MAGTVVTMAGRLHRPNADPARRPLPRYLLRAPGTLTTGASETDTVCELAGCVTVAVSGGSYPTEVGWSVELDGEVEASGSGGESAQVCFDNPTSTPTTAAPTMSAKPTIACPEDKDCYTASTYEELTDALSCTSDSPECSWYSFDSRHGCYRSVMWLGWAIPRRRIVGQLLNGYAPDLTDASSTMLLVLPTPMNRPLPFSFLLLLTYPTQRRMVANSGIDLVLLLGDACLHSLERGGRPHRPYRGAEAVVVRGEQGCGTHEL